MQVLSVITYPLKPSWKDHKFLMTVYQYFIQPIIIQSIWTFKRNGTVKQYFFFKLRISGIIPWPIIVIRITLNQQSTTMNFNSRNYLLINLLNFQKIFHRSSCNISDHIRIVEVLLYNPKDMLNSQYVLLSLFIVGTQNGMQAVRIHVAAKRDAHYNITSRYNSNVLYIRLYYIMHEY